MNQVERRLSALCPTPPPELLRERVLRAAAQARLDSADEGLFGPAWRWRRESVAAVALLIVLHWTLTVAAERWWRDRSATSTASTIHLWVPIEDTP